MTKKIAVYPGSFDPPTKGHLDLILRASKIFDKLIILLLPNVSKKPLFSVEERIEMLDKIISKRKLKNVSVETYNGLLVDYLKLKNLSIVIRGLRAISDFEYEFQMVLVNREIFKNIETIYLMPDIKWSYLSSSIVKELATFGGKIDKFIPKEIVEMVKRKFKYK